jgi:hypothetical protein
LSANGPPDQRLFLTADCVDCRSGSELDRIAAQRCLLDVVDAAAAATGLPRLAWARRPIGPGELTELPIDEPPGIDGFLSELDAELFHHNVTRRSTDRLRLRTAIHYGRNSQLVDSTVLHQALRLCPAACLGVLIAADVFDGLGVHLRPEWLRLVRIPSGTARLFIPGHDVHTLRLRGSGGRLPRARAPSGRVVQD